MMAGVSEFTSRLTLTFWVWFAAGTPDALMAILPVYGVALGSSALGFADTVRVVGTPGNTTPLAGATESQATPWADTVNVTGPPVVVSCNVCVAGGVGGDVKLIEEALTVSVGGGDVTTNVTGMTAGLAKPATVNWTLAL